MKEKIIDSYINKLTKSDIITISNKNNISLSDEETDLILETIKKDWRDIISNPESTLENLKNKVSDNTYENIIHFYNLYRDKLSLL